MLLDYTWIHNSWPQRTSPNTDPQNCLAHRHTPERSTDIPQSHRHSRGRAARTRVTELSRATDTPESCPATETPQGLQTQLISHPLNSCLIFLLTHTTLIDWLPHIIINITLSQIYSLSSIYFSSFQWMFCFYSYDTSRSSTEYPIYVLFFFFSIVTSFESYILMKAFVQLLFFISIHSQRYTNTSQIVLFTSSQ